ncbi:hypothetical protein LINPERPRIM_LOCUS28899 [Linum perenne]
MKKVRSTKNMG